MDYPHEPELREEWGSAPETVEAETGAEGGAVSPRQFAEPARSTVLHAREIHDIMNVSYSPDAMKRYIDGYIDQVNSGREILSPQDREFLKMFLSGLMVERSNRAEEVESKQVKEAAKIANGLLAYPPFLLPCVDGRINPTLMFAMFAGVKGGAIQTPAGDSNDYVRGPGGNLRIRKHSNMDRQLNTALQLHEQIVEVLDSHVACAKRCGDCQQLGLHEKDDGLMKDVLRKKEIAAAMRLHEHPNEKFGGKRIIPIQVSFDPHNGFMYMGLESDQALKYAEDAGGFTHETLEHLVQQGHVISTQDIAREFEPLFAQHYESFEPKPDWKTHYKETALQVWKALAEMKPQLLQAITAKITATHGPFPEGLHSKEIEERATLLLANAFNGFCNNRKGEYEYSEHAEQFVSVTERDYRPCNTMGFAVYSLDLANLSRSAEFASTIVRTNREKGRVNNDAYPQNGFEAAPVPIIVKEIIREPLSEDEWKKLSEIDWSFLHNLEDNKDWHTLNDEEFMDLLDAHTKISLKAGRALQRLRHKMQAMYDPNKPSSPLLIEGKLFALPVLSDKSRRFRAVVPFFLKEIRED